MMKRLPLVLLAAAGLFAIGSGACTIKIPAQPDFATVEPDMASSGMGDMSATPDMTETVDM